MTRLLVTGASGLLGSNIVREASQVYDVIGVVNRNPLPLDGVDIRRADLSIIDEANKLIQDTTPDWIIHCAADTAIDELESAPERAQQANVGMTHNVARACAKTGAQFLYVSTDSVFAGDDGPYSEADIPDPRNIYAQSKLDGEAAAIEEFSEALIVRTNLFGQSVTQKRSLAEWFLSNLKEGVPVPGFVDVYFSPVYAPTLAGIFFRMLSEGKNGLYHVPGADCVSKYEFGVRLARTFGFETDLVQRAESGERDWQAQRPKRTCLEGVKLVGELDFELPALNNGLELFKMDIQNRLLI
jgi:dTDP-4-dehydrorhamnose reductase